MAVYFERFLGFISDIILETLATPFQLARSVFHSNTYSTNTYRTRRRSIVRLIGTYLPLPSAPRVYLNLAAWQSNALNSSISIEDGLTLVEEQEIISEETDYNTQEAIKNLQLELQQLRSQIAAILENQSNSVKDINKDVGVTTDGAGAWRNVSSPSLKSAPPPPAPPLPPAALLAPTTTPLKKKKDSQHNGCRNNSSTPNAINILEQVLCEMKNGRPKLKPIERSPGGGPLKKPRPKTDPSDVLTEVLKRRFSVAQLSDTNDSSDSSLPTDVADIPSSPDWRTFAS